MIRASTVRALVVALALLWSAVSGQATPTSNPDIPAILTPPANSVHLFSLEARGVQIYACEAKPDDATTFVWTFQAPEAELLNARGEVVGRHFAGPTWQGQDGSAVVGVVRERADAPAPGAIPWLLLEATEHTGNGVFADHPHPTPRHRRWGRAERGLRCGPRRGGGAGTLRGDLRLLLPGRSSHTGCQHPRGLSPARVPWLTMDEEERDSQ